MNKKITALLLAAALTTGVGAYGTYAYFSADAKVSENINITLGNLEIKADWTTDNWAVTSVGEEAKQNITNNIFNKNLGFHNVKPGDYFERQGVVKSTGTLLATDVKISLIEESVKKLAENGLIVTLEDVDATVVSTLEEVEGRKITQVGSFKVKVTVDPNIGNDKNVKAGFKLLDENIQLVDVHAEQQK